VQLDHAAQIHLSPGPVGAFNGRRGQGDSAIRHFGNQEERCRDPDSLSRFPNCPIA